MNLLIWRHADAAPGTPDASRPLTDFGRLQAAKMATWIEHHVPKPYRVVSSPALRAVQTAQALTNDFDVIDDLGYQMPTATGQAVLDLAGWPLSTQTLIFVGHQPTVGQVHSMLLSSTQSSLDMQGASLWWFSNELEGFEGRHLLRAVVTPNFL
jgi:phosphohistidine phosphatase